MIKSADKWIAGSPESFPASREEFRNNRTSEDNQAWWDLSQFRRSRIQSCSTVIRRKERQTHINQTQTTNLLKTVMNHTVKFALRLFRLYYTALWHCVNCLHCFVPLSFPYPGRFKFKKGLFLPGVRDCMLLVEPIPTVSRQKPLTCATVTTWHGL